jgi:hypothetical protein
MNRRILAASRIVLSMATVGVAVHAPAEERPVNASELARCAAISAGNERLACYDALAVVAVPGIRIAPATVAAPAGATAAPAVSGTATGSPNAPSASSVAKPEVAAAGAGQPAKAARSANPDDPANFGLNRQQLKAAPAGPDSVKSTVSQITQDRLNNVYLVLDNGQTWGFVEPDPRVRPGDSVTINRAAFGSFLMMTPSRHSYRVQRVN